MVRKAKYLSQRLTVGDMEILDGVVLRYLLKFYALMQKYPSPKKYAKVVIIKKIRLNANIANIYTATFAKNYPSNIFRPGQLNQALANEIRKTIGKDYITLRKEDKEFLHPRDLRERVLKKFESEGKFIHLVTKRDIRHWERKTNQIDKKHSYDKVRNNRGGKPSAYILRDEIEILKKVLRKPEAIDFLYKKIIGSGFAHKFAKYKMLALLHAAKLDEKTLHRSMGAGASFMQDSVKEEDIAKFKLIYKGLQFFDDNLLEQYADNIATALIENRGYYALLFMAEISRI